jgi:hypothetical protein
MNYLAIDAQNVLKYRCIHCLEWIQVEEYNRHSLYHFNDTILPTPKSLQEYIDRFVPIGLAALSDFEFKDPQQHA